MKKILFYPLIFTPLSLFSTTVEEGLCGESVSWNVSSDSVLTISGTGAMYNYAARIEVPWYEKYAKNIRKIVVEDGVSHLGNYAFSDCSAKEVELSNGLKSIGNYTFRYSHNIQCLTIPASLESIGKFAFDQTNLEAVILEGSTPPSLGTKAFVTSNDLSTDIAGTSTTVNELGFPIFAVPCGDVDAYRTSWEAYTKGVYCADSIAKEYDGVGNYHYLLFTGNLYTPKGNSLLISTRSDIEGDNVIESDDGQYTCNSLTLTDTATFKAPFDFNVGQFTLKRSGALGSLVSLFLPVEMPTDYVNGNVFVFNDFDGEYLNFTSYEENYLQANYPYVVIPDLEESSLIKENAKSCNVKKKEEETVTIGHLKFFGVNEYSTFVSDEKNTFIVFNAGKVKKFDKINLRSFRAAFQLTEPTFATLGIKLNGEVTGIARIENDLINNKPVNVYDTQGRIVRYQVSPSICFQGLSEGIYIVNGKKFLLKANNTGNAQSANTLKSLSKRERDGIGE